MLTCGNDTNVVLQVSAALVPDGITCCHLFLGVVIWGHVHTNHRHNR